MENLKAGTKVKVLQFDFAKGEWVAGDSGRVVRWTKASGDRSRLPGYEAIRFDDTGGVLLIHSSGFEVAA